MNKWDTCCKILENAFKMLFKRRSNTCNVGMVPIGRSFSDRKVAPNKYPAKTDLTTKMQTNAHHFGCVVVCILFFILQCEKQILILK